MEKDKEIALLKAMVSGTRQEQGAKKELEDEKKRVYDKVKSRSRKGTRVPEDQGVEELLEEGPSLKQEGSDQEKAAMASKHIATLKVRSAKARDMFLSRARTDPKVDIGVDVKNDAKLLQRAKETLAHSAKMTKELKSVDGKRSFGEGAPVESEGERVSPRKCRKDGLFKGKKKASVENERRA